MKTNYVLEGAAKGPVVVMAHALGATLRLWDAQAAALADRYRVLRYDVRGHGKSEAPPGPYTVEQMAADLRELLESLGILEVRVVGLSLGGCIGMALASASPDVVKGLVLCDTTPCYGPEAKPRWDERIRIAETQGMTEELIERTMEIWFTPEFRERHKDQVDRVRAMLRHTDPRGYAAAVRALSVVDLREKIRAIRCPTLVVVGEKDPGTTPVMARSIQASIPRSRLLVIPGAMHCSVMESADAFNRALLEFLAPGAA
jgi:3-oxoadipate enol-lactonase